MKVPVLAALLFIGVSILTTTEGCMRPPWVPPPITGNSTGSDGNSTGPPIVIGQGERFGLEETYKPVDGAVIQINPELVKYECPTPAGKFPDPLDCHNYYECSDWKFEGRKCPDEAAFDQVTSDCVDAERVPRC